MTSFNLFCTYNYKQNSEKHINISSNLIKTDDAIHTNFCFQTEKLGISIKQFSIKFSLVIEKLKKLLWFRCYLNSMIMSQKQSQSPILKDLEMLPR